MDENVWLLIADLLDLFIDRPRNCLLAFQIDPQLGIGDARFGAGGHRGHAFKADVKLFYSKTRQKLILKKDKI